MAQRSVGRAPGDEYEFSVIAYFSGVGEVISDYEVVSF